MPVDDDNREVKTLGHNICDTRTRISRKYSNYARKHMKTHKMDKIEHKMDKNKPGTNLGTRRTREPDIISKFLIG